jgi:hypothetical protein
MTLRLVPVALLLATSSALAFDTSKLGQFATNVSETNLNWEWTTECGTAAYCAWYVGH